MNFASYIKPMFQPEMYHVIRNLFRTQQQGLWNVLQWIPYLRGKYKSHTKCTLNYATDISITLPWQTKAVKVYMLPIDSRGKMGVGCTLLSTSLLAEGIQATKEAFRTNTTEATQLTSILSLLSLLLSHPLSLPAMEREVLLFITTYHCITDPSQDKTHHTLLLLAHKTTAIQLCWYRSQPITFLHPTFFSMSFGQLKYYLSLWKK